MHARPKILTAIVGDLIGSSRVDNRPAQAKLLSRSVKEVGRAFSSELFVEPAQRGIDELSIVFRRPALSFQFCVLLNERIHPLVYRFAVVEDMIDVGLDASDAGKMDGEAFHLAAEMIVALKKTGSFLGFHLQPPLAEYAKLLSQLATLYGVIAGGRTTPQNEVVRLYRDFRNQQQVARKLKKSQQAISELLLAASWKHLLNTERLITDILTGPKSAGAE